MIAFQYTFLLLLSCFWCTGTVAYSSLKLVTNTYAKSNFKFKDGFHWTILASSYISTDNQTLNDSLPLRHSALPSRLASCNMRSFHWEKIARTYPCSSFVDKSAILLKTNTQTKETYPCSLLTGKPYHVKTAPVEWISFLTTCSPFANRFAESVRQAGIPLTVLGRDAVWVSRWGLRLRLLHDYLLHVPRDRIIIWTDAVDVLASKGMSPSRIISTYKQMVERTGARIFFPAETACYPNGSLHQYYPDAHSVPYKLDSAEGREAKFKYLNAGVMVGTAEYIVDLIKLIYQNDCYDDQDLFTTAFLKPVLYQSNKSLPMPLHRGGPSNAPVMASPDSSVFLIPSMNDPLHQDNWHKATEGLPGVERLIALDYWNELSVAMYSLEFNKDVTVEPRTGTVHIAATKGTPSILHQNGEKSTNNVLSQVSNAMGIHFYNDMLENSRDLALSVGSFV